MLIYEPKKYPVLKPKIGDTVYDWNTGKELGTVCELGINCFTYRDYDSDIHSYFLQGFYYYDNRHHFVDDIPSYILADMLIGSSRRIRC
jgi:hypothetical protein